MVRTSIVKIKNEEGKESASVFGDLIEIYSEMQALQDNMEKSTDYIDSYIGVKNMIKALINETLQQEASKSQKKELGE